MACVCEMIGVACLLALILSFSSKAPYQLKMAAFFIGSAIMVAVCTPFMLFRPRDHRNGLMPAWGCRQLSKVLGLTMEVRGLENVRSEHGSVVLMNHQSALDILVLSYLWPVIGRATVVAKREILYMPFFGIGAWLWGTLFINRSRKSDSISALQKEATAIKDQNCKLLLFPEGTRNSTDRLLPFKKGPFHIALQSKCPVQPVVISKYWFLNSETKTFTPGHAVIHILPEIATESYSKDNMNDLIDKTKNVMETEYTKLSQETKAFNVTKQS